MTRTHLTRGFTLVELVVVIVIVGVLVALAAVAYNSVIDASRRKAVEASATQVAKVIAGESAGTQRVLTDTEAVTATLVDFPASGPVTVADKGTTSDRVITVTQGTRRIDLTLGTTVGATPSWMPGSAY